MGQKDTVLWDFDGTVMDTNEVVYRSWQHTYRTLTGHDGDDAFIYATFGETLADSMERAFPDVPVEESLAVYRAYHYERFDDLIRLFPGMEETLAALCERGIRMGLVTSRLRRTTMRGVRKFHLDRYFDTIVTADDKVRHKPDPEPALLALERLHADAADSLMVGDAVYDQRCAENAGIEYVMVGWTQSLDPWKLHGSERPDHIIRRPQEILALL
ncbi:MAG: HAD family hydrolase [Anaerovoracaceae bacterium]